MINHFWSEKTAPLLEVYISFVFLHASLWVDTVPLMSEMASFVLTLVFFVFVCFDRMLLDQLNEVHTLCCKVL